MKTYSYIYIILATLLFYSCAVIKEVDRPDLLPISKNNFSNIGGGFYNRNLDSCYSEKKHFCSLWGNIGELVKSNPELDWENHEVQVSFLSKRKMLIKLVYNDSLIDQKTKRGRFKSGYFYYRLNISIFPPIFPVWYVVNANRTRVGFSQDKIFIDYKYHYEGFALLAGSATLYQRKFSYQKIKL